MRRNTAGQVIGAQMVSATDGSAFTGAVTCYVTGDGGTQAVGSVGSGAAAHEGNGFHTYAPAQAETDYDHVAFTFVGTGAVPVTVQVYPSYPQTGDAFARLGAPAGATIAADIAAIEAQTDDIGAAGAGLTAVPWNPAWDAEVQSEVADALVAYDPATHAELVAEIDAVQLDIAALHDFDPATQSVTVGANNDKAGYGLADGAITSAKFGAGAIDAAALAADAGAEIADAVHDETVEGAYTLRQLLRLMASALLGKVSGAATTSVAIRDLGDTKNRIAATVTADGDRTAVTLDGT